MNRQQLREPTEQELNEFEIILSRDFENMTLEELNQSQEDFCRLAGMKDDRETISPTEAQRKARDYMWFRITQEENKNDSVKVSDCFYASWGYDQTNIDYYKIIEISKTGKTCKVVKIGSIEIGDSKKVARDMCGESIPDPDNVINPKPCKVKIERSAAFNPYSKKHEQVGKIQLRGSVYFSNDSKHLETLFRCKGSHYWSSYA